MTIRECIERADRLQPNPWTEEEKGGWVLELEGRLVREFYPGYREEPPEDGPERWPEDGDKPLRGSGPWEAMYGWYLMAMMDLHNDEWDRYNAHMELFNRDMGEYRKQYHRTHTPVGGGGFINW